MHPSISTRTPGINLGTGLDLVDCMARGHWLERISSRYLDWLGALEESADSGFHGMGARCFAVIGPSHLLSLLSCMILTLVYLETGQNNQAFLTLLLYDNLIIW